MASLFPANVSGSGAANTEAAGSNAQPTRRTKLMPNVTHSLPSDPVPDAVAEDRAAVVAGVTGIFRQVGITANDLRSWAPWCPALGELADAMDPLAGAA
jgi:hypothetical protein